MTNDTQGAVGAETMTAGRIAYAEYTRRICVGLPWERISKVMQGRWEGLAAALATPRTDSDEGTAGDALKEACKPWEHYTGEPPDDGSPLSGVFVAGMVYTERLLAKLLDVTHYEGGDGSEDFDADATQTLRNILIGARLWDADENRPVTATPAQPAGAVPDSLRALSEAASEGELDTGVTIDEWGDTIFAGPTRRPIARFERQEDAEFFAAAVDHVRTLLATHPAGQSAGSGAEDAGLKDAIAEIVRRAEKDQTFLRRTLARMRAEQEPAPDSTRTGQGEAEERLIGPKMTPEQEARIAHNLCGEFGPDAVIANASFVKAFYAELYAAARPAAPEAQGAWRSQAADEIDAIADLWSGDGRSYAKTIAAILRAEEPEQLPPADAETKRQVQRAWDRFKAGTSAPPASSGQEG